MTTKGDSVMFTVIRCEYGRNNLVPSQKPGGAFFKEGHKDFVTSNQEIITMAKFLADKIVDGVFAKATGSLSFEQNNLDINELIYIDELDIVKRLKKLDNRQYYRVVKT